MREWSNRQADDVTGGHSTSKWSAKGISIDSRKLEDGQMFVAIIGENLDGHSYLDKAKKAGAACAMIAKSWYDQNTDYADGLDLPLLIVEDTLEGLNDLARHNRAQSSARFIGVTGSVGKTGTKESLGHIFGSQHNAYFSTGNFNNHYGLPLTLANMPEDCEFGIFELGMNHLGEISHLTRILRPHLAIITTIQAVHLEHFRDVMQIAEAKSEIFEGLEEDGIAILNRDNPLFHYLRSRAREMGVNTIHTFGEHPEADSHVVSFALSHESSLVNAKVNGVRLNYKLGAAGKHWIMNSLSVLLSAQLCGLDLDKAGSEFVQITAPKGRGAISRVSYEESENPITLIDESYNASPASVRAALSVLGHIQPGKNGRRIAILGDMLELGSSSARIHASLAKKIDAESIDLVYTAGPLMESLWKKLPDHRRGHHAETSQALIDHILSSLRPGDVVTVKGSLGSNMAPIVEAIQNKP